MMNRLKLEGFILKWSTKWKSGGNGVITEGTGGSEKSKKSKGIQHPLYNKRKMSKFKRTWINN